MMSANRKKLCGKIAAGGAVLLAVAIPVLGWLFQQNQIQNAESASLMRQNKLQEYWTVQQEKDDAYFETIATKNELLELREQVLKAIKNSIPGIVCWGDSLTAGINGGGTTYPGVLQSLIQTELGNTFKQLLSEQNISEGSISLTIPVINMAVAGESSLTVAGRNGAIPFVIAEDFVIPAGEDESVRISFTSQTGEDVKPLLKGNKGMEKVIINGVEGRLAIQQMYDNDDYYAYYFTRSEAGESVEVSAGTEIVTFLADSYRDCLPVIMLGYNGGWSDADDLISQINAMLSKQNDPSRYIVIGLSFMENIEYMEQVNAAMQEAFGEHFIDIRSYMKEKGLEDAGIDPSDENVNGLPFALLSKTYCYNADGYTLIAKCVYRKIYELGYIDEIFAAIETNE